MSSDSRVVAQQVRGIRDQPGGRLGFHFERDARGHVGVRVGHALGLLDHPIVAQPAEFRVDDALGRHDAAPLGRNLARQQNGERRCGRRAEFAGPAPTHGRIRVRALGLVRIGLPVQHFLAQVAVLLESVGPDGLWRVTRIPARQGHAPGVVGQNGGFVAYRVRQVRFQKESARADAVEVRSDAEVVGQRRDDVLAGMEQLGQLVIVVELEGRLIRLGAASGLDAVYPKFVDAAGGHKHVGRARRGFQVDHLAQADIDVGGLAVVVFPNPARAPLVERLGNPGCIGEARGRRGGNRRLRCERNGHGRRKRVAQKTASGRRFA